MSTQSQPLWVQDLGVGVLTSSSLTLLLCGLCVLGAPAYPCSLTPSHLPSSPRQYPLPPENCLGLPKGHLIQSDLPGKGGRGFTLCRQLVWGQGRDMDAEATGLGCSNQKATRGREVGSFFSVRVWNEDKAKGEELGDADGTLRGVSWLECPSSPSCPGVAQLCLTQQLLPCVYSCRE